LPKKDVIMTLVLEPQLGVFETARSNSSPAAIPTRWKIREALDIIEEGYGTEEQTSVRTYMGRNSIPGWIWRVRGSLFLEKGRMSMSGEWDLQAKTSISAD
jgi:hypothetical protein